MSRAQLEEEWETGPRGEKTFPEKETGERAGVSTKLKKTPRRELPKSAAPAPSTVLGAGIGRPGRQSGDAARHGGCNRRLSGQTGESWT